MPGYLFHFCSEWQKARKVLQLDSDSIQKLAACIVDDVGELCQDSILVQERGLAGWRLDVASAQEDGVLIAADQQAEMGNFIVAPTILMRSTTKSLGTSQKLQPSLGNSRTAALTASLNSVTEHLYANTANSAPPIMRDPVLFRSASHPLAGLPNELSREDFVLEIRKRLTAERLFEAASHQPESIREPILSVEDAEDLFEALLIMQSPSGTASTLQTGRRLDSVCDRYFALIRLRQLMEKGASTLASFFSTLDLGNRNGLEPTDFHKFVKNAGGEFLNSMAKALAAEGIDVNKLAETLFSALDANKDNKVELWEMQKQMSLSAPPRMSMVELVGHFEMKNGYGKSSLAESLDRKRLFDHLCRKENLDFSPEDVARCFRAVAGGANARLVHQSDFDHFLKGMPLEVSWGVEPHAADRLYCAIGARVLQMERSKATDACLPTDALLSSIDMEEPSEENDTRARFDRLWQRAVGSESNNGVWRQLREGCFRRFLESIENIQEKCTRFEEVQKSDRPGTAPTKSGQLPRETSRLSCTENKSTQPGTKITTLPLPRPLFPNISDVLAIASTQLVMGQACIVRYRLTGSANFWGPGHSVRQNDREPISWPVPRQVLGDTPCIGLVPRGQNWNSVHSTAQVQCELPRDPTSGLPLLFGVVQIVPPSLVRTGRVADHSLLQEFELRLFCSTKRKIIGCIGEPLQVCVVQQERPPPLASLQVRCEGRSAVLRWSVIETAPLARPVDVETVRLHMKSAQTERTLSLDADATEWEVQDLSPDTEYEFRVRLENRAGCGREALTSCRTNACCSAPSSLSCAVSSTASVELRWAEPKALGNETTKDRFQQRQERIDSYEADLKVEEDDKDEPVVGQEEEDDVIGLTPLGSASTARRCQWPGTWRETPDGFLMARLSGLRPDTRYTLENFGAINSMGKGNCCKPLAFWTVPQTPRIASVRVKGGSVIVALSQTGGACVRDYAVAVAPTERPHEKATFELPQTNLREDGENGSHFPELSFAFEGLPLVERTGNIKTHNLQVRASNIGGWSDWSVTFEAVAIAKQQGAEQAQAELLTAMQERKIEALTRLLAEVRDIEFSDRRHVVDAGALHKQLVAARDELRKAMQARDPQPLLMALQTARKVRLPDLGKAEALLRKLDAVVLKLETAKGIDALRLALKAAHEARLPPKLLTVAIERLGTREAAQQGLEQAMEAARVPGLTAALEVAAGMHLPSEEEALNLLLALQTSESLLVSALEKALIVDLMEALKSANESGLREDDLIQEATVLLEDLHAKREEAREHLMGAMDSRNPAELRGVLMSARGAQVLQEDMQAAEQLLRHLEGLIANNEAAVGIEERRAALGAAFRSEVPRSLLKQYEVQLDSVIALHSALERGGVEILRNVIKDCENVGVKEAELSKAMLVHVEWSNAAHEVEISISVARTHRLRLAIKAALETGIAQDQLDPAGRILRAFEHRDSAISRLRSAIASRVCEELHSAFKIACDAEVQESGLLEEAKGLIHHLETTRKEVALAVETKDLKIVYDAYGRASAKPALPESELRPVKKLLVDLQKKEHDEILHELAQARNAKSIRTLDYLARRIYRVAHCGVEIGPNLIAETEDIAEEEAEQARLNLESDVLETRLRRECALWEDKPPVSDDETKLPTGVVAGKLTLYFNPGGNFMTILPREIVEGKLVVPCDEERTSSVDVDCTTALGNNLLCTLRKLLEPEDDLHRMSQCVFSDDQKRRRIAPIAILNGNLESGFAVYVRGLHSGVEIAETLVERGHLGGDLWHSNGNAFILEPPGPRRFSASSRPSSASRTGKALVRKRPAEEILTVASTLTQKLVADSIERPFWEQGPERTRRISDYVKDVRARVLRRVSVELGWIYPRGLMDSLDATCFIFDEDNLVDILDHRGSQGSKYLGSNSNLAGAQHGQDAIGGAVRYIGDVMDDERRTGKQVIDVRLDLMPKRISDLVFVLSAYNSRDLSKFSDLKASIVDIDGATSLASSSACQASGGEAFIMCSLYRLSDGLWRANSFLSPSKGTARDYRPIITRLLELGYPRNTSMRNQVEPLFKGMQHELGISHNIKSCGITIGHENVMAVPYVIELFSNDRSGPDFVRQIAADSFHSDVLITALQNTPGGERFSESHLKVHQPSTKDYTEARLDLRWNYPSTKRQTAVELAAMEGSPDGSGGTPCIANFLDVTCILFEGQALREVIDYRGPHGVRIVHNGVLDYGGVWVGKMNIGDASGGAVWHTNLEMNNANRVGTQSMNLRLDNLPRSATDLFFCLSAPSNHDIMRYSDVQMVISDDANPGHEVCSVKWKKPSIDVNEKQLINSGEKKPMEAMVLCCLSRIRDGEPGWSLHSFGCLTMGNASDYRQMIRCLRAIQAHRVPDKPPPWPHQVHLTPVVLHARVKQDKQALMLPRLPDALVLERHSLGGDDSVYDSEGPPGELELRSDSHDNSNQGQERRPSIGWSAKKSHTRSSLSQIAGKFTLNLKRRFGSGSSKLSLGSV